MFPNLTNDPNIISETTQAFLKHLLRFVNNAIRNFTNCDQHLPRTCPKFYRAFSGVLNCYIIFESARAHLLKTTRNMTDLISGKIT